MRSHYSLEPEGSGDIGQTKAQNRCAKQLAAARIGCCNAAQHMDMLIFKMKGAPQWSLACAGTQLE